MNIHDELIRIHHRIGPDLDEQYARFLTDVERLPVTDLVQTIARSEQVAMNAYSKALMDEVRFIVRDYFYELTGDALASRVLYSKLESRCLPVQVDRISVNVQLGAEYRQAEQEIKSLKPKCFADTILAILAWLPIPLKETSVTTERVSRDFGRGHVSLDITRRSDDSTLRKQVRAALRTRRLQMESRFKEMIDEYCIEAKCLAVRRGDLHEHQ